MKADLGQQKPTSRTAFNLPWPFKSSAHPVWFEETWGLNHQFTFSKNKLDLSILNSPEKRILVFHAEMAWNSREPGKLKKFKNIYEIE